MFLWNMVVVFMMLVYFVQFLDISVSIKKVYLSLSGTRIIMDFFRERQSSDLFDGFCNMPVLLPVCIPMWIFFH